MLRPAGTGRHPLPILNISEHLTRIRLQKNAKTPFVIGGLLGTQNGREVDIVNTFELAVDDEDPDKLNEAFLVSRKEQYKQVFPSLELIGWYTVTQEPSARHIPLHEQVHNIFCLFIRVCGSLATYDSSKSDGGQALPLKAYEPTVEIRDRSSRIVFVEVSYSIETGEAERIAVDWTAKGGEGGTSLSSHLQTQRAAVKMLHDRIQLLIQYVSGVVDGTVPKDYTALRSLSALLASLPASEHPGFREEFDKEYEDVQLTAFLSALTSSTKTLNELTFLAPTQACCSAEDHNLTTTMNKPEILTLSSVVNLFDLKGLYLIGYSWLFGMSLWVTFFGGVIAYRALPRQQFGALQHRTFPVYFVISMLLSSTLTGLWTYSHPDLLANLTNFRAADVVQAYTLASIAFQQGTNHFLVGPLTSKIMFQRHKLEKAEGKSYNEEGVSNDMKALNKRFAQMHGWSSMFNLNAVIALIFHGLWIGHYGLGGL
ncbi:hypothetical protein EW145_g159 [Phellinidium pouzarii]|uniref:COP9 signalosome complex subunit 6 n=1 Tax=Phellinidium pouzarii TaxID=167371 RepID=A0A4V3XE35_9AGAM|nr:hypothetical protein EW145_g159 [Phellinidium pouzarii]